MATKTPRKKFPPNEASRIMLEEVFSFCQTNASSNLKDIRFVVYQQDQTLITAFKQEMANLVGPSTYRGPSIEVINADLTQEKTDALLNIISTDMNMNNAGELSKAILKRGGPQIQQECSQLGNQIAGSAVMTSGGNLAAPKVIHIIPGFSFFRTSVMLNRN